MPRVRVLLRVADKAATHVVGLLVIVLGIILMPLPGPGMLITLGGVALLARHNVWAQRVLEPVQRLAYRGAMEGVATWPRVVASALSALVVMAVGIFFWIDPRIPAFSILGINIGPELPFGGLQTGLSIVISSVVAFTLLGYSVLRFRYGLLGPGTVAQQEAEEQEAEEEEESVR